MDTQISLNVFTDISLHMYITISGAHGIGKTTLSELIARKNNWEYLPEAIDITLPPPKFGPKSDQKVAGQYWFMMQVIAKENKLRSMGMNSVVIVDRSWQDILIYSKTLLNETDYNIYKGIISELPKKIPDLQIILDADTSVIAERIKNRNRGNISEWGEDDIEYLDKIVTEYRKYYDDFKDILPVKKVDASGTLEQTYKKTKNVIEKYLV